MTKPTPKEIKAMADVAGVPVSADVAARIANSIGPAFEGFAAVAGTLPFDLEPASFLLVQAPQRFRHECDRTGIAFADRSSTAIAQKKLSSREVTQSCLDRIAQWQPHLNAFMAIEAEAALAAADKADAALAKGDSRGRVARRPAGAQGYVLRRRQGRHLRFADKARFRRDHDVDGAAAPEGFRHDTVGLVADGGIRLWTDRPQQPLRPGA